MSASLMPLRNLASAALACLALGHTPAAPATPSTYVVVLKAPALGPQPTFDHVQFTNSDGVFGIPAAGFGGYVDKGRITVPRVSDEEVRAMFGPALDAMQEILAAGLPPLSHSYVVLLPADAAPAGYLGVVVNSSLNILAAPGQAMLTDGYSYEPFMPDQGQLAADFGPALQTLAETRKAGLPVRTYIVLLENPDGTAGKIIVSDEAGTTLIEEPGQAMRLDAGQAGTFRADPAAIRTDFGAALDARPPLPAHVTLFFELGTTKLTPASQDSLQKILADLRDRPLPEVRVEGHTDTVGSEAHNDKLARRRADLIAGEIRTIAQSADHLDIESYGPRKPLVPTPKNTPEPKNRRVEVYIR
ncbi:MAG: OmpA family protein [Thiobacillus sp.]|nr:OmpA family protein [Thiobacillus sp.]